MTETLLALAPTRQRVDFDLSHEVCCADEQRPSGRIAMCGVPLEDGPLDEDTPSCVVCQDLVERWARDADTYGDQVPCRLCPRRKSGVDN